ncbi:MAG: ribonuclease HII [Acidobacteriota bacterium]
MEPRPRRGEPSVSSMSLRDIRACYFRDPLAIPPSRVRAALAADPRAGAASLLAQARMRLLRRRRLRRQAARLLRWERPLWRSRVTRLAGVDEAGMGSLAGPVVAAAVILPPHLLLEGLTDSKALDRGWREHLYGQIQRLAVGVGIGQAGADEVDRLNVYHAGLTAMQRAVEALAPAPEHLLVDARHIPGLSIPQKAIVHGDALSLSIAAASVIAKVTRDRIMEQFDRLFPGYGLARHKGYATATHREAIIRLGPSPIHRRSFTLVPGDPVQEPIFLPAASP